MKVQVLQNHNDFAYGAFGFDAKNPSILASENGKDVAIEIYSLSKGYNMSGFRVGFAVGNKDMIQALKKYQTHTNAGMFERALSPQYML